MIDIIVYRPVVITMSTLALSACAQVNSGMSVDANSDNGRCSLNLVRLSSESPTAPEIILVAAETQVQGSLSGWQTLAWQVWFDDSESIDWTVQGQNGEELAFVAQQPGVYEVVVMGEVGGTVCEGARLSMNVAPADAPTVDFVLRFTPQLDQPAPPQERLLQIPQGVDYDLQTLTLDSGRLVSGSVQHTFAGPLTAYIRATSMSLDPNTTGIEREAFSDLEGAFSLRLQSGVYDVLIIPVDDTIAPALIRGVSSDAFTFELEPGIPVLGTVRDPMGMPLDGARISMRVDEVPSSLAITDVGGAFAVQARDGDAVALTVAPPGDRSLPRLSLPVSADIALDSGKHNWSVAYAPTLSARAFTVQLLGADGSTPMVGARVIWIAQPIADAGRLTVGAGSERTLTGDVRVTGVSQRDGTLSVQLPDAVYDVIVQPDDSDGETAVAMMTIDLQAGQPSPASLVVVPGARVTGQVRDESGQGLADVPISAIPMGALAQVPGAAESTLTAADGGFSLLLSGRGQYRLSMQPQGYVRARVPVTAPAPGQHVSLEPVTLQRGVSLTGSVDISATPGGARDVTLTLRCHACPDDEAQRPIAETTTDVSGGFQLLIPATDAQAARASTAP